MAELTLLGRLGQALLPRRGVQAAPPRPRSGQFSRSYDSWWQNLTWLTRLAINDDRVLALEGGGDLDLYDQVLDDPKAFSAFQQRRLAVISRPWEVEPGAEDARSKAAAEHLRKVLNRLPWDDITEKMLYARWYGYGIAEAIWGLDEEGLIAPEKIIVPDRRWFSFTNAGECRMRSPEAIDGLMLPERKFWIAKAGASHDFVPYGVGLAHWCYWPVWFKRNGVRFWALFLEKFGMPTAWSEYPESAENDPDFKTKLLDSLVAIGNEAAIIMPEGTEPHLLEATRSGSGAASYDAFKRTLDQDLEQVILGQTMTSSAGPAGLGSNQAEVQKDVRDEIVRADSDLLSASFNESIARWMTEWNFPGATPPRVFRKLEDEEDLDTLASRDGKIKNLGWERTDESFVETYGEGYQRIAVEEPAAQPGRPGQPAKGPRFAVGEERTAYVSRRVVNAEAIIAWAKKAGFASTLKPADMHVTIAYSRAPFDWLKVGPDWTSDKDGRVRIKPGGPRLIERLGSEGAVVLMLGEVWDLTSRHREIVEAGASWDYEGYHPHVTLTYEAPEGLDLEALTAFDGEIILGPEKWEPLKEDWSDDLTERAFSAEQLDEVDRIVAALLADQGAAFSAMLEPIKAKLRGVRDPAALRVALLEAAEKLPAERFAAAMATANLAVRALAESGIGDAPPEE